LNEPKTNTTYINNECQFAGGIMLTGLSVVYADSDFDGTIIHCFNGRELVLAFVTRAGLDDYFEWPWSLPDQSRPSLREHHLVVDRNLVAIESVIQEKYRRDDYCMLHRYGSSLKFIEITHADIPREKITLTNSVIQVSHNARLVGA
jgi:hypothetical protein